MEERKGAHKVLVGKLGEEINLEVPDVDGRVVLKCIIDSWNGGMEWIEVAQDMAVVKLQVS
jgi:hypothetical protein